MPVPRELKQKSQKKRYHHGDLRRALIEVSLDLIETDGLGALTLREVARRLWVSHAAPQHHFTDKAALLAVLAAQGFSALADAMILAAEQAGDEPVRRLNATGVAYVTYAVKQPQRFSLMFETDITETSDDTDLKRERARALAVLTDVVNEVMTSRKESDSRQALVYVAGAWATVHGLATLWIDRRFAFVQSEFPTAEALARAVTDLMCRLFEKNYPD